MQITPRPTDSEHILKFIKDEAESEELAQKLKDKNEYDLCLNDYIINVKTWEIREYSKTDYKFSKLPYNYTDISKYEEHKPKRRLKFLDEVFITFREKDQVSSFIQEMFGYFLLPMTRMEKFFLLYGDGRNGK